MKLFGAQTRRVPGTRPPRRFERRADRRTRRARAHLERRRRRGQVLGVENPRGSLAVLQRFRRLRLAACGLCGLAAGLLVHGPALHVGFAWWKGQTPRAESISVSGHARLAPQDVALATGVAKGSLLTDIDAAAVVERLASHPWIRAARAAVLPSGELLVKIEERKPRAVVRSDSEKQEWWVDDSGVPFTPAEPELAATLPQLRSHLELVGGHQREALTRALAIVDELRRGALRALSPAGAAASEGAADWPQGLELHLPTPHSHRGWVLRSTHPHVEVILGEEGIEPRVQRLAQLLSADLQEVRGAESIDLRFADRAVLRAASVSRRGGHQVVAEHGGARPSKPGGAGDPLPPSLGGEKHGTKR